MEAAQGKGKRESGGPGAQRKVGEAGVEILRRRRKGRSNSSGTRERTRPREFLDSSLI